MNQGNETQRTQGIERRELDVAVYLFLILTPIFAVIIPALYFMYVPFSWDLVALFFFFSFISSMSITAGYHRLLSHRSYKCKAWLKNLYLFIGAGTFQSPALLWVADHRRHHRYVDTPNDPYNIKQGFWHAHISWLFYKFERNMQDVKDLQQDRWIMLQQRYFVTLAIFSGFILPALVFMFLGSQSWWLNFIAGLIFGGLVRIVYVHHCTFFINSLCHMWGGQEFSKSNTARDNFLLAIFTNGEGYHNFHHKFQYDYRNGIHWYQYDPTKWLIAALSWLGQTHALRRTPKTQVLLAKMALRHSRLVHRNPYLNANILEKLNGLRQRMVKGQERLRELYREHSALRKSIRKKAGMVKLRAELASLRAELKVARIEVDKTYRQWCLYWRAARFAT